MTKEPRISIIMAVLNGEKTIEKSLKSALDQDYKNLEVIVVNDGSTDRTVEIVEGIGDDRIKLINQENQGVSKARNVGLESVTGDYFCFLDADDLLTQNSISSRMKVFNLSENIAFVDGVVEERNLSSGRLLRKFEPSFSGNPLKELLMLNDSCFCGQTWLVKNDKVLSPRFNEGLTHGEDLHFFIEYAKQGGEYDFTTEPILIYNRHEASAMSNLSGLHKFYRYHTKSLSDFVKDGTLQKEDLKKVTAKVKRILFRSYFKAGKFAKAILTYFKI